ncbi:RNA-directed DNA polymerase, eukaryota, reverse transcriptase zinc-binding domain protein [Tanacetum coccineum]
MYAEVIDVSSDTSSSTAEITSSSTSKLSSLSTLYGSDDEDFSSPSAEVVTCAPVPTKDEFEMETEEETEEEKEEETDDDKDDETWTPKPIGTSSSTPSTKKTSVNRGEPVRHCIIGLVSPKTYELISKKEFGVRKEVNESKEQDMSSVFFPGDRLVSPLNESLLCLTKVALPVNQFVDASSSRHEEVKQIEVKELNSVKCEVVDGIKNEAPFLEKCVGTLSFDNKRDLTNESKGDVALKVLYKRLYALEMCKSISVAEKMGHPSLSHSFHRMPRGGVDQENYGLLCSKVADLVPPKFIRLDAEVSTRWLRVVPIKVNVHAWRVCLDKLPTRANLSLRGMDIPSIACPLCNSAPFLPVYGENNVRLQSFRRTSHRVKNSSKTTKQKPTHVNNGSRRKHSPGFKCDTEEDQPNETHGSPPRGSHKPFKVEARIDIPSYDGTVDAEKLDSWLDQLETYFTLYGFTSTAKVSFARLKLTSHALAWWNAQLKMTRDEEITWNEFKRLLRQEYYPMGYSQDRWSRLTEAIVDTESEKNLISSSLVERLGLETTLHPRPYSLGWIKKDIDTQVNRQCKFRFAITNQFIDEVTCEVVPLDICQVIFGSPYLWERDAVYFRRAQKYELEKDGKKYIVNKSNITKDDDLVKAFHARRMVSAAIKCSTSQR